MEYYSAIKKNEILSSVTTWRELESIKLSEISETERHIPYDLTYRWNFLKNDTENRRLLLEAEGWRAG